MIIKIEIIYKESRDQGKLPYEVVDHSVTMQESSDHFEGSNGVAGRNTSVLQPDLTQKKTVLHNLYKLMLSAYISVGVREREKKREI